MRAARKALQQARGKQKLDLILDSADPGRLVRALPAEELYFTLLDVGPDDAAALVAMAAPEQFRHFVDMSAWGAADEPPRMREVLHWLRLAREGGDTARFRRQLAALDVELLALLFRRELSIHDLDEDNPPQPSQPGMAYYTPDRRFLLEFTGGAEFASLRQLLDDLYAEDAFRAGQLIEAARWEQPTELEELARRWREGRLRDAGVPQLDEALAFYARRAAPAQETAASTGTALAVKQRPLLEAALELLSGEELEQAEESAVYAANAALVANRAPLTDADEVRATLADARATLSLGLELLSGGDAARAARLLVEKPVRELFQTGMSEAYRLQTRARKIAAAARLPQAQSATVLDEPLESALQALLSLRPQLREPGQRRPRAFGSRADVALASSLLDEAEAMLALLGAHGIPPSVLGPKAEEAGLGPAAVKASGAIWALIESQLNGRDFSLHGLAEEVRQKSPGFDQQLHDLVRNGVQNETGGIILDRLKKALNR
ncbi:MAG TPA: DUF6178 family protein [Myxococcales bacterium]|nr:DUF6178 family protein [Myxococcales bacterium]